jgi:hypothetical protein
MSLEWSDLNPLTWPKAVGDTLNRVAGDSQSTLDQRNRLNEQAGAAGSWADQGQQGYGRLGAEAQQARDYLRRVAMGQESIAGEQLRQGMGRAQAAQQSMAAGASPQNQAMAQRNAAMNMGRAQMGMSGQAALAGIQERRAAQEALMQSIMQQRGQDMQVGLGSRQNAISGYTGVTPEKSFLDKWGGAIMGGAAMAAK